MIRKEKILAEIDPVCGVEVNPDKTHYSSKVGDDTKYFCSEECLKRFKEDPGKYTNDYERDE